MTESPIISKLALEGHDSELFSFLDKAFVDELTSHPAANVPLWSFGKTRGDTLLSVTMWNTSPRCFSWTHKPYVSPCTFEGSDRFVRYRALVTDSNLLLVSAITLVRYLFEHSYTCALDDREWITTRVDPTLERLAYIRGYRGKSTSLPEWMDLQVVYFDWALEALNKLQRRMT